MKVLRIPGVWNLLRLASAKRAECLQQQKGTIRLSICFGRTPREARSAQEDVAQWIRWRREFSGWPCACRPWTVGQLMRCLVDGHRGVLGLVREAQRRAEVEWGNRRWGSGMMKDVIVGVEGE
jgi:hypothetical protein